MTQINNTIILRNSLKPWIKSKLMRITEVCYILKIYQNMQVKLVARLK